MKNIYLLFFLILSISCNTELEQNRIYMNLDGEWQFALDLDVGIGQKWYNNNLNDVVKLLGTTDSKKKGFRYKDTITICLNRVYKYEGVMTTTINLTFLCL